ncbi:MAG: hypothetical protein ACK4F9_07255 [Brevinematia bacterium]
MKFVILDFITVLSVVLLIIISFSYLIFLVLSNVVIFNVLVFFVFLLFLVFVVTFRYLKIKMVYGKAPLFRAFKPLIVIVAFLVGLVLLLFFYLTLSMVL